MYLDIVVVENTGTGIIYMSKSEQLCIFIMHETNENVCAQAWNKCTDLCRVTVTFLHSKLRAPEKSKTLNCVDTTHGNVQKLCTSFYYLFSWYNSINTEKLK